MDSSVEFLSLRMTKEKTALIIKQKKRFPIKGSVFMLKEKN